MSSMIPRLALRASRPLQTHATQSLRASGVTAGSESAISAASRQADKNAIKQGARRDPELLVRIALGI